MPVEGIVEQLRAAGCVFAEDEAAEILRVRGEDREAIAADVAARAAGTPLEQVLGVAVFDGLDIALGPGVFVPRRRAEALLTAAVAARPDARVVVDLGCGAGAIAAALARRLPSAEVHGVDLDDRALEWARVNASRHGFAVHRGDWWAGLPSRLRGSIDLAVAYLPHVPVDRLVHLPDDFRRHEPRSAVDGGHDGLRPLAHVLRGMPGWLSPHGLLVTLVAAEQRDTAEQVVAGHPVALVVA